MAMTLRELIAERIRTFKMRPTDWGDQPGSPDVVQPWGQPWGERVHSMKNFSGPLVAVSKNPPEMFPILNAILRKFRRA